MEEILRSGIGVDLSSYKNLSPFELQIFLLEKLELLQAKRLEKGEECKILHAGRGNPDFFNTTARQAVALLTLFSCEIAETGSKASDVGIIPKMEEGLAKKLEEFLVKREEGSAKLLLDSVAHIESLGMPADTAVWQLMIAALGCLYPAPPRILEVTELVLNDYFADLFYGGEKNRKNFKLFATEGGTAAMVYLFSSLQMNKILFHGDRIAQITPIYAPYLEVPELHEYDWTVVPLEGTIENGWEVSDEEIEKLSDPRIKVLFLVDPGNPTSYSLGKNTVGKIVKMVKKRRPDLVIIVDNVYTNFVDEYHSLLAEIPENTIGIFAFSKYFGATGWRIGTIIAHENCVVDRLIHELPQRYKNRLSERYSTKSSTVEDLSFIERIEMDSRDVALAHTGGLSGPQQMAMCFFALFDRLDKEKSYKCSLQQILDGRLDNLYEPLKMPVPKGPRYAGYYTIIDLLEVAKVRYGEDFAQKLAQEEFLGFIFKLALEKMVLCLPGYGFGAPNWTIRISLANLADDDYKEIGTAIDEILRWYYMMM